MLAISRIKICVYMTPSPFQIKTNFEHFFCRVGFYQCCHILKTQKCLMLETSEAYKC